MQDDGPLSPLEENLLALWPTAAWDGLTIMVGVSGGADSVALLTALACCRQPSTTIIAAHYNHRLRGSESDEDQQFVRELCESRGIKLVTNLDQSIDPTPSQKSDESALRAMRYEFLEREASRHGARYLVTAHNRDDQAETILFRILRGTSLAGLVGIPTFRTASSNPDLVIARPLLTTPRSVIEDYLRLHKQAYRIDSSNPSNLYTRNWIRNQLLPSISERFGKDVSSSLIQLGENAKDYSMWINEESNCYAHCVVKAGAEIHIDAKTLSHAPWLPVQNCIRRAMEDLQWPLGDWTRNHWLDLRDFLGSQNGAARLAIKATMHPGGIRIVFRDDRLILHQIREVEDSIREGKAPAEPPRP